MNDTNTAWWLAPHSLNSAYIKWQSLYSTKASYGKITINENSTEDVEYIILMFWNKHMHKPV